MSSATTTTTTTTEQQRVSFIVDGEEDEQQQHEDLVSRPAVVAREMSKRVSRLAVVEGGGGDADGKATFDAGVPAARRSFSGARTLPPPHAWLAIKDTRRRQKQQQEEEHGHGDSEDPEAEQWARLLRGGATTQQQQRQQRRSSFSVVRRERAAREAWLDHAWEAKRSWHQRNGGAPDADTPVVVVVGTSPRSSSSSSHAHQQVGGGVAMDVEEVRACRDLGLELPSDCTVEIQCYGLSGGGSSSPGSGADSPCNGADSCPDAAGGEADPMDVKARLKVWAQAVALASTTTHLAS